MLTEGNAQRVSDNGMQTEVNAQRVSDNGMPKEAFRNVR
jgi:hypothetical protein